jgi:hypothetical protein
LWLIASVATSQNWNNNNKTSWSTFTLLQDRVGKCSCMCIKWKVDVKITKSPWKFELKNLFTLTLASRLCTWNILDCRSHYSFL